MATGGSAVVSIIFYIISVLGMWRMFQKAGESAPFIRALIPFVNQYTLFKISWKTSKFWLLLILEVLLAILTTVTSAIAAAGAARIGYGGGFGLLGGSILLSIIIIILCIITIVVYLRSLAKVSRSFGHGIGVAILFLIFPWLTSMVLGFGSSEYLGPQE